MKIMVYEPRWLNGSSSNSALAQLDGSGSEYFHCVFGFALLHLGVTPSAMLDMADPDEVWGALPSELRERFYECGLVESVECERRPATTGWVLSGIIFNDRVAPPAAVWPEHAAQRKIDLIHLFAQHGHELVFTTDQQEYNAHLEATRAALDAAEIEVAKVMVEHIDVALV